MSLRSRLVVAGETVCGPGGGAGRALVARRSGPDGSTVLPRFSSSVIGNAFRSVRRAGPTGSEKPLRNDQSVPGTDEIREFHLHLLLHTLLGADGPDAAHGAVLGHAARQRQCLENSHVLLHPVRARGPYLAEDVHGFRFGNEDGVAVAEFEILRERPAFEIPDRGAEH